MRGILGRKMQAFRFIGAMPRFYRPGFHNSLEHFPLRTLSPTIHFCSLTTYYPFTTYSLIIYFYSYPVVVCFFCIILVFCFLDITPARFGSTWPDLPVTSPPYPIVYYLSPIFCCRNFQFPGFSRTLTISESLYFVSPKPGASPAGCWVWFYPGLFASI